MTVPLLVYVAPSKPGLMAVRALHIVFPHLGDITSVVHFPLVNNMRAKPHIACARALPRKPVIISL